jgi:hypothetical protein
MNRDFRPLDSSQCDNFDMLSVLADVIPQGINPSSGNPSTWPHIATKSPFEEFEILHVLAKGGFGSVFLVNSLTLLIQ